MMCTVVLCFISMASCKHHKIYCSNPMSNVSEELIKELLVVMNDLAVALFSSPLE